MKPGEASRFTAMTEHDDSTNTTGQRLTTRREEPGIVRLSLDEHSLAGSLSNVSSTGVMFTIDGTLAVTVEIERDGEVVQRTGRLSRVQRLNASELAVAVEFDDDRPASPDACGRAN